MDIFLIFLLIFSATPFVLWADGWVKTALFQIPFIFGAWFAFLEIVTSGIQPNETYLWLLFYGNILYGHIAFTIAIFESRRSAKRKAIFANTKSPIHS